MKPGVEDAICIIGIALISYGAWCIYEPAGYITGGVLLLAGGVAVAKGRST